jgi:hypothetical protein
VFENSALRRIFGNGKQTYRRTLHNQFENPYFTPNIIRSIKKYEDEKAGDVAHMRQKKLIEMFGRKTRL